MMVAMEKQIQDQVHVQQALKCPRCDSSNTKFCYYNNYSLSQPRHFCKACKRYWTRGGTLRNVPVGGGYRKNKRVKQASSSIGHDISTSAPVVNPSFQSSQVDVSLSSTRTDINNNLFYNLLANNIPELNFPFSTRESTYDLTLPRFNGGLGFLTGSGSVTSQNLGLSNVNTSVASLNPLLSSYPMYGTSSTSTSTMASTIASNLHQQKMASNGFKDNAQIPYGAMGFDDLPLAKDVKMEGQGNWLDWNMNHNYSDQEINSSDPSFVWNSSAARVRFNTSNIGPSVPSMI